MCMFLLFCKFRFLKYLWKLKCNVFCFMIVSFWLIKGWWCKCFVKLWLSFMMVSLFINLVIGFVNVFKLGLIFNKNWLFFGLIVDMILWIIFILCKKFCLKCLWVVWFKCFFEFVFIIFIFKCVKNVFEIKEFCLSEVFEIVWII